MIFDIAWNWAMILAAYGVYFWRPSVPTLILAIVFSGIHWHRLAIMGHDAAHFLFFKNRLLNDAVANLLCFYPLTSTIEGYRDWHFVHHRTVGTSEDPELAFKKGRLYERPVSRKRFLGVALLDCLGLGARELTILIRVIAPKKVAHQLPLLAYWFIVLALLWETGYWEILCIHVLSMFTAFWAVFRVRGWSEHVAIEGTHRFSAHPIFQYVFFPHKTWCHYEHHQWPSIPYRNLPAARELERTPPVLTLEELFDYFAETPTNPTKK